VTATVEVEEKDGGVRFDVRVTPKAQRNRIGGEHDGALRVAITAAPVDGAANDAIIALFAKRLRVPKRAVTIVRGPSSRDKALFINGVTADEVLELY